MKILMLGWEFPPVYSGGLGVVTKHLMKHLLDKHQEVTLLLPQFIAREVRGARDHESRYFSRAIPVMGDEEYEAFLKQHILRIDTTLRSPYLTMQQYLEDLYRWERGTRDDHKISVLGKPSRTSRPYGRNLFAEIDRYVGEVLALTAKRHFDIVHAHDWITAEAALQLKFQRGIPFILHIHATEYDRVGGQQARHSEVFRRERYAMESADKIIAVSHYTKSILVREYGIDPTKIAVVHNAYQKMKRSVHRMEELWHKDKSQFWVLFIGRVTLQKGPDYFLEVAKKVIPHAPDVHFLIAGDGDMLPRLIEDVARNQLHNQVHCLGFLTTEQRDALYRFTDACIIPSVSEPFGLTAIEVAQHRTPLILSRTCGANELIGHKLSVDFWDTDQMAEYVLALHRYPALRRTLRNTAKGRLPKLSWGKQTEKIIDLYHTFR